MLKRTHALSARHTLAASVAASLLFLAGCDDAPSDPLAAAFEKSEEGDLSAARIYVQQALQANPTEPAAIMLYGKTELGLENPVGAAEQFKKLLSDEKFGVEANAMLAKSYLQSGQTDLALETLENSATESGLGYAVSVVAQLSEGEADKALAILDEGLTRFPESIDLIVLDAKRAYDQRDLVKGRALTTKVLEQRPNMIEARLLAGRLELSDRKLGAAQQHFEKVLQSNSWNLPAILSMAAIARENGDSAKANEWVERAKSVSPENPVGAYCAAQMAFEDGDIEEANKLVQSMGSKSAEFPALRKLRGFISAQRNQTFTAITELERFFRLGGDDPDARITLAHQYALTGADQKAWDMLQPVLTRANVSAATLQLGSSLAGKLGLAEQQTLAQRAQSVRSNVTYGKDLVAAGAAIRAGQWDKADTIYQQILKAGGANDPVVLNNAANIRLERGDKDGAVALARKAFMLAPSDPIIMDTLGWSLIQVDPASGEGRELIARALELAPGNVEINNHWIATERMLRS
jgi:tetratricopeptide (TPR) repeat protein